MRNIRCMVAGYNGNGEPDIWFVKVQVPDDYEADEDGKHYPAAKQAAENNGYEGPFVAFDEIDHAGNNMLPLFAWETASIIDLDGNEIKA